MIFERDKAPWVPLERTPKLAYRIGVKPSRLIGQQPKNAPSVGLFGGLQPFYFL